MVEIIKFGLVVYGVTSILVDGSIFEGIRGWLSSNVPYLGELVGCYRCMGFWTGVVVSQMVPILEIDPIWLNMLLHGAISSGICWVMYLATFLAESNLNRILED